MVAVNSAFFIYMYMQCISCLYIFATNSYVRGKIHCKEYLGPGRVMSLGHQRVNSVRFQPYSGQWSNITRQFPFYRSNNEECIKHSQNIQTQRSLNFEITATHALNLGIDCITLHNTISGFPMPSACTQMHPLIDPLQDLLWRWA